MVLVPVLLTLWPFSYVDCYYTMVVRDLSFENHTLFLGLVFDDKSLNHGVTTTYIGVVCAKAIHMIFSDFVQVACLLCGGQKLASLYFVDTVGKMGVYQIGLWQYCYWINSITALIAEKPQSLQLHCLIYSLKSCLWFCDVTDG